MKQLMMVMFFFFGLIKTIGGTAYNHWCREWCWWFFVVMCYTYLGLFPNHIPNPEDKTAMMSITQAVLDNKADLGIISLLGRPYRIVDYLLLAGLVWEKNTVPGWKFTIVYEQANRLIVSTQSVRDLRMHEEWSGTLGLWECDAGLYCPLHPCYY